MSFIKTYWPGLAIFLILLITGLMIYPNYGVSTDELGQTGIGMESYKYVFEGDTSLQTYADRDHGVGFELPILIIAKQLNITDNRDLFLLRHVFTHIFFLICMLTGYFLTYKLFKNQFIACASFIMLVMDPRLYGHSFFNSKDIPSMAALVLILSAAYWAFEYRKPLQYLLLGAACGYAMSIRLMNMMVVPPLLFFAFLDVAGNLRNADLRKKYIVGFIMLIVGCWLSICISWPLLWHHPVHNLVESYHTLARFRWQGMVLLAGTLYDASALPWSYIPTWFFVTVPEFWLFLGLAGIIFSLNGFLRKPLLYFQNSIDRHLLLYLYSFIVPVVAVVALKSVLYDDWRHLYFIYPPFILLAAYGMNELLQTKFKKAYIAIWFLQIVFLVVFMFQNHPYEYVYFNNLVSHKKDKLLANYPLDYWGLSNKDGLEWVLAHSADDSIYVNNQFGNFLNRQMLTPDKRNRIILTDDDSKIEYYIERGAPYRYPEETAKYQIIVSNSPIIRVTRIR